MKTNTTKTVTVQGSIPAYDLKEAVRRHLPRGAPWYDNIKVTLTVRVPSGGDFSGMQLTLGDYPEVTVDFVATWTETEES